MTNEDMIGSNVEGSSAQREGVHDDEEEWHTAEELKSTASPVEKDYAPKGSTVVNEAKDRVRTLREDGEEYVRKKSHESSFHGVGRRFHAGSDLQALIRHKTQKDRSRWFSLAEQNRSTESIVQRLLITRVS